MQVGENGQNNRVKELDKNPSFFLIDFSWNADSLIKGLVFDSLVHISSRQKNGLANVFLVSLEIVNKEGKGDKQAENQEENKNKE